MTGEAFEFANEMRLIAITQVVGQGSEISMPGGRTHGPGESQQARIEAGRKTGAAPELACELTPL